VESRKEFMEGPVRILPLPELIYNEKKAAAVEEEEREIKEKPHHHHHHHPNKKEEEKQKGVKIVEVSHHHMSPAVEGTQLSYAVKEKDE